MIEITITGADHAHTEHLRTAIINHLRSENITRNVKVAILNSRD